MGINKIERGFSMDFFGLFYLNLFHSTLLHSNLSYLNTEKLEEKLFLSMEKRANYIVSYQLKGGVNMYPFKLPELKYSYNALEPYIDALTMEIHYTKHHGAYVNNLNAALEKYPYLQGYSVEQLLQNLAALPQDIVDTVRNNGGGHLNHTIWWEILSNEGSRQPVGELSEKIKESFGSFENFKEQFNKAAMSRFGSGWAFLVMDQFGKLHIISLPNQDNPIMQNLYPIFGVDVWEHSYYLKYQNRRADYLNAVWSVLNWEAIEKRYQEGKKNLIIPKSKVN